MGTKLKSISSSLVLLATMTFPSIAVAETETPNYETLSEVFERAFFKNAPNFYGSQTLRSQINVILGSGSIFRNSFPENQIARDAELVHTLYRDALNQQATSDPYIRTPDLPNPYNSSLLVSPRTNANKLRIETEPSR
ncbi:hypothetical protein BZZ01_06050 [Nostocales cyanobacterium HT-58-2]|nr:hypothetical protein BZZ01_06050 [Nostocales cyanobacterium HT-58-2]